jgi:nicotinate-nucleotide--dimethylbenzimidazole phosphoribosyltransferase
MGRFAAPTEARAALAWGVATADDAVDDGADLLLVTVPDPSPDQVDTRVLGAHLLGLDPVRAVGWPEATGLDDDAWARRVAATRDGLRRVAGIRGDPDRLLEHLGNPALSAGTALLLQAAARRTPAVLDGPGAAACALLAVRAARPARTWWQAADLSGDPLHDLLLTDLRLEPLTRFGLTDPADLPGGDGTAARIALTLLEAALERAGTESAESEPAAGGDAPADRPTLDEPAPGEPAAEEPDPGDGPE